MESITDIKEYPQILVNVEDLIFDKKNPNTLTQEQIQGIHKSFRKFGNLESITIDQNNFIVHGNHRALVYKQLGMKTIPAIRREFKDDIERMECAQALNKLHGEYEKTADASQLMQIFEAGRLEEFAELIAKPKDALMLVIERQRDLFQSEIAKPIDTLETQNECPQCGYKW